MIFLNYRYRNSDNEKAIKCYSKSIYFNEACAIVYVNRSIALIRLSKFEHAFNDCTISIQIPHTNDTSQM